MGIEIDYSPLYVKIDGAAYRKNGEIRMISRPMSDMELVQDIGHAPKGSFEITRTNMIYRLIELIGGKKGKLVNYLLKKKDMDNCLHSTNSDLSKQLGLSLHTVIDTMSMLESNGLLARREKVIMINPSLLHKGSTRREQILLKEFNKMPSNGNHGKGIDK